MIAGSGNAQAQVPGGAQAEAQARLVCGSGTVLNANYLPGGLLRVTCQSNSTQNTATNELPSELQGTTLTTTTTATVLTVVAITAIIIGDNATSTSTSAPGL